MRPSRFTEEQIIGRLKEQVRRRGGRERALGRRRPMLVPDRANARWSLDFLSDTISDGRRFRVLAIADDYASAWRSSPTPRFQACAWLANWMTSSVCAADPRRSFPTTAPSSPRWRSCAGARTPASRGTTSPQADAERLRRELQRTLPGRVPQRRAVLDARRGPWRVTVSVGGATCWPNSGIASNSSSLVEVADRVLYSAKNGGRDRAVMAGQIVPWPRAQQA